MQDETMTTSIRQAVAADAHQLAKLIDIAGEGIPSWLWQKSCQDDQSPVDIGTQRAQRLEGGFSFTNAMVAERDGDIAGMVLSYPIEVASDDDPNDLPAPIAPFVELENQSVGTWYVNALAVFPAHRNRGIGASLMQAVQTCATQKGYGRLSIQVYAQNTDAVRLYQQLGYDTSARSPVRLHPCQPYYTGDVLLLMKTLDA